MATEVFNRTEKKYILSDNTYHKLISRLEEVMKPDHYNDGDGYTICNLYFDTWDSYYIRNSLQKPYYKEKLRLRGYGVPQTGDKVYMEIKKKVGSIVNKRRSAMTLEQAYGTIDCEANRLDTGSNSQVLREIDYIFQTRELFPMMYIAYDRKAYYDMLDHGLRVTFDYNIRTRREDLRLEMGDYGYPLLKDGLWLMEIKSEGGVPLWLAKLLSEYRIYPAGFSKYGAEYLRMLDQMSGEGERPCLSPFLKSQLMPLSEQVTHSLAS